VARRALEAARGEARDPESDATPPPLLPDEEELVAERLVEAKMCRRYKLLDRARTALETVLGKVSDHPEARAELAELERDEADKARDTAGERQSDREMGLIDEAIAELQLASRDPQRLVDCASLLASCFVEKGLPALAVQWLERGLEAEGCGEEARHALRYELGAVLEAAGETERALEVFTGLYGEAAGHRDVAARIERLRGRPRDAAKVEEEE